MEVKIKTEYIKLQQFLKLTNTIVTGGEIKPFLLENEIKINDVKRTERGAKIYPGDIVIVNDEVFTVIEDDELDIVCK